MMSAESLVSASAILADLALCGRSSELDDCDSDEAATPAPVRVCGTQAALLAHAE
jgi:hypothetical protein